MKTTIALLLTTALVLPIYAFAADDSAKAQSQSSVEQKDNGGYTANVSSDQTDANGTRRTTKETEDVTVDNKGNTSKEIKTKITNDPKGLGNETTRSSSVKIKQKDNGGFSKMVKTKKTDNSGTDVTTKSSTDTDVDSNGNVTKTTKTEKTVDPKTGLFSGQTTSTSTKTVNGKVVDEQQQAPDPKAQ